MHGTMARHTLWFLWSPRVVPSVFTPGRCTPTKLLSWRNPNPAYPGIGFSLIASCRLTDSSFAFITKLVERIPDRLPFAGGTPAARRALWVAVSLAMAVSPKLLVAVRGIIAKQQRHVLSAAADAPAVPAGPTHRGFGGSLKAEEIIPRDPKHGISTALATFMRKLENDDDGFGAPVKWNDVLNRAVVVGVQEFCILLCNNELCAYAPFAGHQFVRHLASGRCWWCASRSPSGSDIRAWQH